MRRKGPGRPLYGLDPEPVEPPPVERVPESPGRSFAPWESPDIETDEEAVDPESPWLVEPSDQAQFGVRGFSTA